MIIRSYKQTDCEEITAMFYDTVHSINARDYTREQLDMWATGEVDIEEWNGKFLSHYTLVAIEDGVIVGFGDIDDTGYIDKLYVHKDFQHRGIASAICDMLEQSFSGDRITVHASITAKPFFLGRGYIVEKEQTVVRKGVELTNFLMSKKNFLFDE